LKGIDMKDINMRLAQLSWILCTLLLAFPILGNAEIYKWKDKDGSIRYTDTPPPSNIKQEAIGSKKAVKPSGKEPLAPVENAQAAPIKVKESSEVPENAEDAAAEQRQRNAEADKRNKQEKEAEAKRKAENCSAAKANFETYKQGGRVYKMNEKGEREYMSDQDLQAGKAKAQAEIDDNCS
jgi:type IV secretory pathway VirB10-like protein